MKPNQYRWALRYLAWQHWGIARVLGITTAESEGYADGTLPIPEWVARKLAEMRAKEKQARIEFKERYQRRV